MTAGTQMLRLFPAGGAADEQPRAMAPGPQVDVRARQAMGRCQVAMTNLGFGPLSSGHAGLHDLGRGGVGLDVGGGPAVLEVATALPVRVSGNADRAPAIRDAVFELLDGAGFVQAREAVGVPLAVDGDVLCVLERHLVTAGDDVLDAACLAHALGGEVYVSPGSVPVALDGLGLEGHEDVEVLGHAVQDVTAHPELIPSLDAHARADLVLPLAGHHLRVRTRDLDTGVTACDVVSFGDGAAEHAVRPCAAIIRTLWSRISAFGPAERSGLIHVEQSVLLLYAKPRSLVLILLEELRGSRAVVCRNGLAGRLVGVAQDQEIVVVGAEGICEEGLRLQDNLAVISGGLASG
mmetsp:Transcript_2902/g.8567  ORF Transcript_2902/g.8567 Transcript_2902/m.8567 type:complete len:350 (+) Transcript_2902:106-1155(+)